MADDGIYRKTEKGRTEIATRVNKLGQRERTMLIMVDDRTTRADFLSRSAHPGTGEILDSLLTQGYIEMIGGQASPVTAAALPGTEIAPGEVSLASASRFACSTLVATMGPAADDLTVLIEKSRSRAELALILDKCRVILQGTVGTQQAEAFWAGVSARLPKA